ncbi:hypothetical protein CCR75_001583 [Bremia lactucae]|uniref:Coiled-coil domain-containing protein 39 n=1 Tax=Bremia lactucae TaxID=4779 RepID=A0A976ICJ7_BRELC|nr:hypothetical protein CCR75_001583 [Bremia lactucae]
MQEEKMSLSCADEEGNFKVAFTEIEIGELRKYIVEMMHAETKLLENISLNEQKLAMTNAQIKCSKESITQERARFLTLKKKLEGNTHELKSLEVMQVVLSTLEQCCKPESQLPEYQKLCGKVRQTQQLIEQVEKENTLLNAKRAQLEEDAHQCKKNIDQLRKMISTKEKESKVIFYRLRDDTSRVTKMNAKIEGKLKTKRRKFRLKTKNEINTLKRRIFFISSGMECEVKRIDELEREQMTNEDALSSIDASRAKREILEQKQNMQNEQLATAENAIAELSTSIIRFSQDKGKLDIIPLQKAMSAKRDDAQNILTRMEEKQLDAALTETCAQITSAKNTFEKLYAELIDLRKYIDNQEAKSRSLSSSVIDARKRNCDLETKYQDQQREKKGILQNKERLHREKSLLLEEEQRLVSNIKKAEHLDQILCEGIKHGTEYADRLRQTNELCDDKEKCIELKLRHHELNLQQMYAQQESKFKAAIVDWDEKIKRVERQLRAP